MPSRDWPLPLSLLEQLGDQSERTAASSPLEEQVIRLFDEYRAALLRYTLGLGLRPDDGEEVVQEVFLALFQHLRLGKPQTHLRGWLFRVTHNLALRQRARNGRRSRMECEETAAQEQPSSDMSPEETLLRIQRRQRLLRAVETLPETDRCCLYLRAEGLRYREIAEILGVSLGGVSLALSRSLAKLGDVDRP